MSKNFTVTFVTGNKDKWNSAKKALEKYPIELLQQQLETPEIQSMDVGEIAGYSASYAAKELGVPVIKTDCGYYITALNGFPGPFVKYFNQSLTAEDILQLMKNNPIREVIVRECLAYAAPNQEPALFFSKDKATLAHKAVGNAHGNSPLDRLLIYEGFSKPQAACDYDKILEHWSKHFTHYHDFAKLLCK